MPDDSTLASILPAAAFPRRELLRCGEVARVLGCSPQHIANLAASGAIPDAQNVDQAGSTKRVSSWRIPVASYEAWIKSRSNLYRKRP